MDELKGAFIYGVGFEQDEFTLLLANNKLKTAYKIFIGSGIECDFKKKYNGKELNQAEINLLALSQLMYLTITEAFKNASNDFEITFESDIHLKILGLNNESNSGDTWRLYQIEPESKAIIII